MPQKWWLDPKVPMTSEANPGRSFCCKTRGPSRLLSTSRQRREDPCARELAEQDSTTERHENHPVRIATARSEAAPDSQAPHGGCRCPPCGLLHRIISARRDGHRIRGPRSLGAEEIFYCKGRKLPPVMRQVWAAFGRAGNSLPPAARRAIWRLIRTAFGTLPISPGAALAPARLSCGIRTVSGRRRRISSPSTQRLRSNWFPSDVAIAPHGQSLPYRR
jgi:hypothetical protein